LERPTKVNDTVILVALGDEFSASRVNGLPVIYTGVGKVNAALAAAGALSGGARTIINYGSAGAVTAGLAGLIECGSAVQRDMDLRPLGTPLGDTYGDPGPHAETWGVGPVVGTGDSFAEGAPELACDLVDMEAYAIAKACRLAGANFICLKYISDAADEAAAADWEANKARGANLFEKWLKDMRKPLET
jgi:adenosylhomocysteine nucleosidase